MKKPNAETLKALLTNYCGEKCPSKDNESRIRPCREVCFVRVIDVHAFCIDEDKVADTSDRKLGKNPRLNNAVMQQLVSALEYALFHIDHRLRHRPDLFTDDEKDRLRAAIAKAKEVGCR